MAGYTVVDVETTGLVPERTDRIVELAITYVSHKGQVQDHWSTLVNPQRDVGPTRIHGISSTEILEAPTFQQIAPYVMRALEGRIIVAHNASFDLRFLAAEFVRAGVALNTLPLKGLCTMRWAPRFIEGAGRRLVDCCDATGVQLRSAHSAAGDSMATAQLLAHFLQRCRFDPPWTDELHSCRQYRWPSYSGAYPEFRLHPRGTVLESKPASWLDRVISRVPRAESPRVDEYLSVLEMALLDGFLAEHEKEELVTSAQVLGLTRGQLIDIHGSYLRAMAAVALQDGVVTDDEQSQLRDVAKMLGLSPGDVDTALDEVASDPGVLGSMTAVGPPATLVLQPGDRVVFTGDMQRQRSEWEELARRVGLVPGGVTKTTRVVVASDPNSLSGKAAKARSYGIPIVTEAAFGTLLAAMN